MSEAFATISLDRERAFKRMLALSAGVHLTLLLGFLIKPPRFEEPSALPAVVALVDASELEQLMAPAKKPAKPTPAPEPEAAKPEPPPEPEKIVIPEDNQRKPEQRKPEHTRKPTPAPPRELEQVDLEDLIEETRAEVGSLPQMKPKGPRVDGPTGPGIVDPERARWQEKVRAHVRRRWDLQPGFRGKGLSTEVVVTLSASGQIFGFEIRRSSGNPWFDESVDRYLSEESELPAPPRGDDWSIIFDGDF